MTLCSPPSMEPEARTGPLNVCVGGHICVAGGSIKRSECSTPAAQGTGAFHPGAKSLLQSLFLSPLWPATVLPAVVAAWLPLGCSAQEQTLCRAAKVSGWPGAHSHTLLMAFQARLLKHLVRKCSFSRMFHPTGPRSLRSLWDKGSRGLIWVLRRLSPYMYSTPRELEQGTGEGDAASLPQAMNRAAPHSPASFPPSPLLSHTAGAPWTPHSRGGGNVSLESPFHSTDSGCFENDTNRASDHALVQEEIVK